MSAELVAAVAKRVLEPLVAGGELRPVAPIGEARALAALPWAAQATSLLDEVRARRVRVARRFCAVDAIGDPTPGEWLMLFALNDILQSTNPTLLGPFGADRPRKLLVAAQATLLHAGPPATVGEALSRHATFARVLEIVRIDTHVSFWVGKRVFRGVRPPARVLAWRNVRRVKEREHTVRVSEMAPDIPAAQPLFTESLAMLLAATPLTDLANAGRDVPPYRWTGAALALIATRAGRTLAQRAVERARAPKTTLAALRALPESIARPASAEAARAGVAVAELCAEIERRTSGGLSDGAAPAVAAGAIAEPRAPA